MFLSIGEQLWLPGVGHAADVRLGEGSWPEGCEQRRALPGLQQDYGREREGSAHDVPLRSAASD